MNSTSTAAALRALLLAGVLLLGGCAGRYFQDAGAPAEAPRFTLAEWPSPEIWAGVIFNGEKIGFSHLRLRPAPDAPARFEIEADAVVALRFLGLEKKMTLRSLDVVRNDLTLERVEYRYV
ncbi:MAG TPA: hypothetical protein VLC55_00375, partial [Burkholderiales bacterium]|nr:hypothetical protein [Burkholderiales bacterium]